MIGMIIVGTRRQHDVGVPAANLADNFLAHFERGQQFAIVIVQNFVLDSQAPRGFLGLAQPPLRQCGAAHGLMAGIPIGDRNELDRVAQARKQCGRSRCANIAIVRMRAERDDPNLLSLRQQRARARQDQCKHFHL